MSILAPAVLTKDVTALWWLNFATVAASYGYGYYKQGRVNNDKQELLPLWLSNTLKALDYGSGGERGKRSG